ncbi:carboxypeptidase D-like [Cydia fagiglandana]|uniref:carboxypeptidase D-like n=1 Tax=Cydia fagiglandana TaxID=1458189 RepID=UPI002FEDF25F
MLRSLLLVAFVATAASQSAPDPGFTPSEEVSPTVLGEVEARDGGTDLEFRYHDHEQLTRYLRAVSARYPALTALYSIGKSVQGRWRRRRH